MTWLAWRQFRAQALVALSFVVVVGVVYGATGIKIRHLAHLSGYPGCLPTNGCRNFFNAFHATGMYPLLFFIMVGLMYLVPVAIGVFWGAPLVARELASGSYRMLWTQSITRARWLGVKLLVVGVWAALITGLLSLIGTWWATPIDAVGISPGVNRFFPVLFGSRAIVPIGYALFSFVVGVVLGILVRRTLPAMAITVAVLIAVQIVTPLWIRPHLESPVVRIDAVAAGRGFNLRISAPGNRMTIIGTNPRIGSWVLADQTLDSGGHIFVGSAPAACLSPEFGGCKQYIFALHLKERFTYQPANRYWPFQIYETLLFLLSSLGLVGLSMWRIRRV